MIKYNEEVKSILKRSELEALKNKDEYVDSSHLLLSLTGTKNTLSDLLVNSNITYETIKKEIKEGTSNKETILYSKEILNILENIIIDEDIIIEEITLPLIFKSILKNKKSKGYKILYKININLDNIINSLNKEQKYTTPLILNELGINLNNKAKNNELDKVIGRDLEIERIIEILERKNKNNPILIGEAGVGKTAIVEELARRITLGDVPNTLKNKIIINLNLFNVIAGTKYRGEFEEKLSKIINELESNPNIILFIDEIHTIMGAGGAEGAIDASNIMKPALARNKIKVIGATTLNEYKSSIEKDKALERRFQKVLIKEPNYEETKIILHKIKKNYENYHNVKIPENILDLTIKLSDKYITDRKNPDKSIDILDEICACTKINDNSKLTKLNKQLVTLKSKKIEYLSKNNLKMASIINEKIKECNNELSTFNNKITQNKVTTSTLKKVLESKTNTIIYELEKTKTLDNLKNKIINKYNNINTKDLLTYIENHLNKTTTTPTSIEIYNCDINIIKDISSILKINFLHINLNEYEEPSSINKILGSPQGYIGYEDKNTTFEIIKTYPISIIYLDNYESCSLNIKTLIKNILKTGILNLSNNDTINFSNTIFIIPSKQKNNNSLGFINNNKIIKSDYTYTLDLYNTLTTC